MSTFNPSQNDIARAAGVSRATVSRALSNHYHTADKTKERILKIATDLGYQRNAVVSMLTSQIRINRLRKPKMTLGYITTFPHPGFDHLPPAYHSYFKGAKRRAHELGYELDVIWGKEASMTGKRLQQILIARGIAGLLIAPRPHPYAHVSLDWSKFAAVSIGHVLPAPRLHCVHPAHYQIMDIALRMAKRLGYRRVGFAVGPDQDKYTHHAFSSRYLLYQAGLPKTEQVPTPYRLTSRGPWSYETFARWYEATRPDLLLGQGSSVKDWMQRMGYNVPDDAAYANIGISAPGTEEAGVDELPEEVAASGVDLLVEQLNYNIRGIPEHPKLITIAGEWVPGHSMPRKTLRGR